MAREAHARTQQKKAKKLDEFERQVPHYIKDVGKQRVNWKTLSKKDDIRSH